MTGPLLVTAWLDSPLAGDPPHLDALLEFALSPHEASFREGVDAGVPHHHIDRALAAPPQGVIGIPVLRVRVGGWQVACCSAPILPAEAVEAVDHIAKRIAPENALLLAESERKVISTTDSWTKSYRLPLRIRVVACVRWFCVGNERGLKKALRRIRSIGKKIACGYGRVRSWETQPAAADYSWFAPSPEGATVLMRSLPLDAGGASWLPSNLVGSRRCYGACVPPYWHPERFTEIVVPC